MENKTVMDTTQNSAFIDVIKLLGPDELEQFYYELDLSPPDIEKAKKSADSPHPSLQARKVLELWDKRKGKAATRQALLEALWRCGYMKDVQALKEKWNLPDSDQADIAAASIHSSPTSRWSPYADSQWANSTRESISTHQANAQGNAYLKDVQHKLIQLYKQTRRCFPLLPSMPEECADTDEIFVELEIYAEEGGNRRTLKSHNDLLNLKYTKGDDIIKCILLQGNSGCGKTFAMSKLAYDWANCYQDSPFSTYQLVFVINVSEIIPGSSITDTIKDQLLANISNEDFNKFIDLNDRSVLWILDGYDEAPQTFENPDIKALMQRTLFPNSGVIVTTRVNKAPQFRQRYKAYHFTTIHSCGFSQCNVKNYISKLMKWNMKFRSTQTMPQTEDDFIRVLETSDSLRKLSKIPIFLKMLCLLGIKEGKLPNGLTSLYNELILELANIYLAKYERDDIDIDKVKGWVESYCSEIGQIALEGLFKEQLKFDVKQINSEVLDQMCNIGIVNVEQNTEQLRKKKSFTFIHKTFQEICAAMFLAPLANNKHHSQFKEWLNKITQSNVDDMENLLTFCCGISNEAAKIILPFVVNLTLLQDLEETCIFGTDFSVKNPFRLPLLLLYESENESETRQSDILNDTTSFHEYLKPLVERVHIFCTNWPVDTEVLDVLNHFISNYKNGKQYWLSFVKDVSIKLEREPVTREMELLHCMTNLNTLNITGGQNHKNYTPNCTVLLQNKPYTKLTTFVCSKCTISFNDIEIKSLKDVQISKCKINNVQEMACFISNQGSLLTLSLDNIEIEPTASPAVTLRSVASCSALDHMKTHCDTLLHDSRTSTSHAHLGHCNKELTQLFNCLNSRNEEALKPYEALSNMSLNKLHISNFVINITALHDFVLNQKSLSNLTLDSVTLSGHSGEDKKERAFAISKRYNGLDYTSVKCFKIVNCRINFKIISHFLSFLSCMPCHVILILESISVINGEELDGSPIDNEPIDGSSIESNTTYGEPSSKRSITSQAECQITNCTFTCTELKNIMNLLPFKCTVTFHLFTLRMGSFSFAIKQHSANVDFILIFISHLSLITCFSKETVDINKEWNHLCELKDYLKFYMNENSSVLYAINLPNFSRLKTCQKTLFEETTKVSKLHISSCEISTDKLLSVLSDLPHLKNITLNEVDLKCDVQEQSYTLPENVHLIMLHSTVPIVFLEKLSPQIILPLIGLKLMTCMNCDIFLNINSCTCNNICHTCSQMFLTNILLLFRDTSQLTSLKQITLQNCIVLTDFMELLSPHVTVNFDNVHLQTLCSNKCHLSIALQNTIVQISGSKNCCKKCIHALVENFVLFTSSRQVRSLETVKISKCSISLPFLQQLSQHKKLILDNIELHEYFSSNCSIEKLLTFQEVEICDCKLPLKFVECISPKSKLILTKVNLNASCLNRHSYDMDAKVCFKVNLFTSLDSKGPNGMVITGTDFCCEHYLTKFVKLIPISQVKSLEQVHLIKCVLIPLDFVSQVCPQATVKVHKVKLKMSCDITRPLITNLDLGTIEILGSENMCESCKPRIPDMFISSVPIMKSEPGNCLCKPTNVTAQQLMTMLSQLQKFNCTKLHLDLVKITSELPMQISLIKNIHQLEMSGNVNLNSFMSILSRLASLEKLTLKKTKMEGELNAKRILSLKTLKHIETSGKLIVLTNTMTDTKSLVPPLFELVLERMTYFTDPHINDQIANINLIEFIKEVELIKCQISSENLCSFLSNMQSVTNLTLEEVLNGDSVIDFIVFLSNSMVHLEELDLSNNRNEKEYKAEHPIPLPHNNQVKPLRVLKVNNSNLTDEDIELLPLNDFPHLTQLDLSHNEIHENGFSILANLFQKTPHLQHLDLSYNKNPYCPRGRKDLFKNVVHIPDLEMLCLSGIDLHEQLVLDTKSQSLQKLKVLKLAHARLTDNDIKMLTKINMPQLTELDLSFNTITSKGVSHIKLTFQDILAMGRLNLDYQINLSKCKVI